MDTTGLTLTHQRLMVEVVGYPLTFHADITYTDRNNCAEITQVDLYRDAHREVLWVDGLTHEDFDAEQWANLHTALTSAIIGEGERKRLDRMMDKLQASLCGFGFRTERWS